MNNKTNKILTALGQIKVGLVRTAEPFVGGLVAHVFGINTLSVIACKLVLSTRTVFCSK